MDRINDPTAAATLPPLPTFAPGSVKGYWQEYDPATGTPATIERGYWFNMIQEELYSILSAAGVTPDAANNALVLASLRILFQASLGYTPVQQGTGAYQAADIVRIGLTNPPGQANPASSGKVRIGIDGTDFGNIALENWVNGGFVPGIMKVGLASAAPSGTTVQNLTVTFPTPFNTCFMAHATPVGAANSGTGYYPTTAMPSFSRTGASFAFDTLTGVGSSTAVDFNQTFYVYWWAWGI